MRQDRDRVWNGGRCRGMQEESEQWREGGREWGGQRARQVGSQEERKGGSREGGIKG